MHSGYSYSRFEKNKIKKNIQLSFSHYENHGMCVILEYDVNCVFNFAAVVKFIILRNIYGIKLLIVICKSFVMH